MGRWDMPYSGAYNLALVFILTFCFIAGLVLFLMIKPRMERQGVLMFLIFLAGSLIIAYGTLMYESGNADTLSFMVVLAFGLVLEVAGVGLMVIHLKHTSRLTGYYSMWLFGILLIMFMPLHELELVLSYSTRDFLIGYVGLGISILGAGSFAFEHRQSLHIEAWATAGDAKYIAGKFDESIEYYDLAISIDPENEALWASKGAALLRMGFWAKALECFDKALDYNQKLATAMSGKGLALTHLKRYSEALEYHDKAIARGMASIGWNNKGNTLLRMGAQIDEALACYKKSLEADPAYEIAWYNKGRAEARLGKFQEAASSFGKAVELRPKFADAWFQRARALSSAGSREEALFCYDMTIQLKPSNTDAWSERKILQVSAKEKKLRPIPLVSIPHTGVVFGPAARVTPLLQSQEIAGAPIVVAGADSEKLKAEAMRFASEGRYDKALEYLDASISKFPDDPITFMSKGILLSRIERLDAALESFDGAIRLAPKWVGPLFSRGMVLAANGEYDQATESFDKAIALRPGYSDAWSVKGIVLGTQRKYAEAIKCFDKVIELRPDDEEAWRSKGIALNKLGRYEDAIECFEALAKLRPGIEETYGLFLVEKEKLADAMSFFREGVDLAKSKEYDRALEKLEMAIERRPNFVDALYISGVVFGVLSDYQKANQRFDRVLELRPGHIEAMYSKGSLLMKEAKYSEALVFFDDVLKLKEDHADAWCDRGLALTRLGKDEEALVCYDRVLSLAGDHQKGIQLRESCVKAINEMKEKKKVPG